MSILHRNASGQKREPLTNSQLLTFISVGIFIVMYLAAIIFMGDSGFQKPQMLFDLLNDNAMLIIIACALTVVMIGGGINISVGGVICLTCMACSMFLNESGIEDSTLLLLVSAFVGGDWRTIYDYALTHGFRFLSYGDSSLLVRADNN